VGLREKLPDFDSQAGWLSEPAGEWGLVEARHQIDRTQMCVSLQHSQFFMPADGAHFGNI